MAKKLTMTDIAKKCGVSQTLVSFVLSGKDYGISDTTRQKVIDTAAELGYKTPAATLVKTIGVIIDKEYKALSLSNVLSGIYETLTKASYSIILCDNTENISDEKLLSHKAFGYIIISSSRDAITDFSSLGLPFSFVKSVSRDDGECGKTAAEALLEVLENHAGSPDKDAIASADIPGARSSRRDSVWLL